MLAKLKILILLMGYTSIISPISQSDTVKTIACDSLRSYHIKLGEKNYSTEPNYGYPDIFLRFDTKTDRTNKTVNNNVNNAAINDSVITPASYDLVSYTPLVGLNIFSNQADDSTINVNGCGLNIVSISKDYINFNGLNINLMACITKGNVNGLGIGILGAYEVNEFNGLGVGVLFGLRAEKINGIGINTFGGSLNGVNIGFACGTYANNGIIIGVFANSFTSLNGVAISFANISDPMSKTSSHNVNGLAIGVINKIDINGLSVGLVNFGESWIQIGLVNKGNSTIQIGLLNFDENMKFNLPLIYIRL